MYETRPDALSDHCSNRFNTRMMLGFDNEKNAFEQTSVKEKQKEAEFGQTIQVPIYADLKNHFRFTQRYHVNHKVLKHQNGKMHIAE